MEQCSCSVHARSQGRGPARARFASAEALYALSHIENLGRGPDTAALDALRPALETLDPNAAGAIQQLIDRYLLAIDMIAVSEEVLEIFDDTLDLVPASDWAAALEYTPSGPSSRDGTS
jgi:hypothetical protein